MTKFQKAIAAHAVVLSAALWFAIGAQAAEVLGVKLADSVKVGASELVLNGAGVRTRFFIKVYVGALYLPRKSTSPAAIIEGAAPRRMALRLLRDIDAHTLQEALDKGLRENLSGSEQATVAPQAEQLAAIMRAIGKLKEGDTISIDLFTDNVAIGVNGAPRGKVAGTELPRGLLKVWLGEKPADAELKQALLGG